MIVDLHVHSRFSMACSKNIDFDLLEKYAKIKGVDLLGTSDFQHPKWFEEINSKLTEDSNGILWSKNKFPFLWQTEISLIYTQDGRGRRIHHVILVPNKEVAVQFKDALGSKGRLDYDGRPIFGFGSIELIDMVKSISNDIEVIPAHCMTPWFGIFGSKSGFDSVEECFKDKVKHIHAVETGMSADPPMLRRVSKFDKLNLVSFSDSHSYWPWRLAREATILDCDLKYKDILKSIREGNLKTIEVIPDYGKYHYDGHRACGVSFDPKKTKELNGICPKCGKPLTIGVEYRIEELADREEPKLDKEFLELIPLHEIIAVVHGIKQLSSKKVWDVYNRFIQVFNNEFNILINVNLEDLRKVDEKVADVVVRVREGKLKIKPGYDGLYGELILSGQKGLGEF